MLLSLASLGPACRHSRNRPPAPKDKPPVQDRPLPTLNMVVRSATVMPFMPITVRRSVPAAARALVRRATSVRRRSWQASLELDQPLPDGVTGEALRPR